MAATIWVKYKGYDSGAEATEGWQGDAINFLSETGDNLPEAGYEHAHDDDMSLGE